MDLPSLVILDVGHGNSAVLHDNNGVWIFDAGLGSTISEYLLLADVREVAALLISHSDADHVGGAINLLSSADLFIRDVYINPDAKNVGDTFDSFRRAVRDAKSRGTKVHPSLTTSLNGLLNPGTTTLQILEPAPETALSGPGGRDLNGKKINANSMSAVIRMVVGGRGVAFLAGDMDNDGLTRLRNDHSYLHTEVLVFPHHGGKPGRADPALFATELCKLVQPKIVLFSIGRGRHNTPNPEIVMAVRDACPGVYIACTQLSVACSARTPDFDLNHLSEIVALGRQSRACCLGSFSIPFFGSREPLPLFRDHSSFVDEFVRSPLCRIKRGRVADS